MRVLPPEHSLSVLPFQTSLRGGRCARGGRWLPVLVACTSTEASVIGVKSHSVRCQGVKTPQIPGHPQRTQGSAMSGLGAELDMGTEVPAWPCLAGCRSAAKLPGLSSHRVLCKVERILLALTLTHETECPTDNTKVTKIFHSP